MKHLCRSIFMLLISSIAFGQDITVPKDTSWKKGGFISLNFTQVSLTAWAAGGQSSISLNSVNNFFANYKKEKTTWDNNLDINFGFINPESEGFRKNEDRLELNSKYGTLAKGKFNYSGLLNFRTQFAPGYSFPDDSTVISRFLAPGYLTIAVGMEYKPNDWFSLFLSPATGKFTFVMDDLLAAQGAFGVEKGVVAFDTTTSKLRVISNGKSIRSEFGAYLRARLQKEVVKNVMVMSSLQLFNNYTDKIAQNRGNVDVNLDLAVNMKINKYMGISLSSSLIYDHDINIPYYKKVKGVKTIDASRVPSPQVQFKEVLGVGFSYKF